MGTYKISGLVNTDSIVYIIDETYDQLERTQSVTPNTYEIPNISSGLKTIVALKVDGETVSYGGIQPVVMSGTNTAYSSGKDGAVTIDTGGDTTINSYAAVTATGTNQITVDSASGFEAQEEVLIVQMQGGGLTVGLWETKRISSINSNIITFTEDIENTYSVAGDDKVQAVKIPNYTTFEVASGSNIICPAWDGSKGGIIFFRATQTVTIGGAIVTSEKGFRGGVGRGGNTNRRGWCGESTQSASYQTVATGAYLTSGGGGAGWCGQAAVSTPTGGAGGGYGTVGQNGRKDGAPAYSGSNAVGGPAHGSANLDKIFLGSAGGGGGSGTGGHGGGIIIISAFNMTLTGSISSNGKNGNTWTGSGSGGTIRLQANSLDIGTNLVNSAGGSVTTYGGYGGAGRIRLDYTTVSGSGNNPTPGYEGGY